ncbi:MAG: transaldolase family protein [Microbacterium sp.]
MPELFLDDANRDVILPLLETGEFTGVTTNPIILHRAGIGPSNVREFVSDVYSAGAQTLCMQVWGLDHSTMLDAGRKISSLDERMYVKVPWTLEGRKAGRQLIGEGVHVLATAVLSVSQVISAQSSGVSAISPYLDMIDREHGDAINTLRAMTRIDGPGKMIVADIHSPGRVAEVLATGVVGVTTEPDVLLGLCDVAAAQAAAEMFEKFNIETNWTEWA